MHVFRIWWESKTKDMTSFVNPSLIKIGLSIYGFVVLLVAYTSWVMVGLRWDKHYTCLLHVRYGLFMLNKIIWFKRNMENHPGKPYNHNTIMAPVLAN